jgi:Tol biopolymer transport system component
MQHRTWLARAATTGVVAAALPLGAYGTAHATGPTGRLAFQSDRSGDMEIYVAEPDGSNPVAVASSEGWDMDPVWSPDGSTLAFFSDRDGNNEVYTVGVDGTGLTRLTNDPAPDDVPAWSPDGTKIAYGHGEGFDRTIWTMNADGTGKAAVPNAPASAGSPVYSPDGTKLAFTAWEAGSEHPDIWTIGVDGSGLTKVTDGVCDSFHPKWSPDGSQLAFDRYCGSLGSVLAVAPAVGGPVVTVPGVTGWAYAPNWLPNAFTLVFAVASWSDENGFDGADVYQVNLDGTGLTQLTNDPAWDDDPSVDVGAGLGLPGDTELTLGSGTTPAAARTASRTMARSTAGVTAGTLDHRPLSLSGGRRVNLAARLTADGAGLAGERVVLYARPLGTLEWVPVASAVTDVHGRAAFVQRPIRSTEYVVTHWTTPAYGTSVSGTRQVVVARTARS